MEDNSGIIDKILQNRSAAHALFWVILFSISVMRLAVSDRPESVSFSRYFAFSFYTYLALLPSQMICAYLLTYYQIPRYLYKKKYLKFALSFAVSTYLLAMLARILTVYFAEPMYVENLTQEPILQIFSDPAYLVLVYVPSVYFFAILMAAIKLIKDRYKERERIETLKKEKIKAELDYLKAQIHPHFLLNTLNNLYALTLKKSDKAPETVIKLSEMLVYILYKCDGKYVLLEDEIKLIENYMSLEKLRYGDNLKLSFNKNVPDKNARIAPLILLSIVENAFKHGVSGEVGNAEIEIGLNLNEELFIFEVFNTKSKIGQPDETDYTKGIGASNIKKQLELVYPNRYSLHVDEKEDSYHVSLRLKLNTDEN
ncbi:MAG: histidine kinase [Pyrinomonadaceae bacterium]